ncbi:MAG: hypothetical protein Q9187_003862 [Circinaria calcarea]
MKSLWGNEIMGGGGWYNKSGMRPKIAPDEAARAMECEGWLLFGNYPPCPIVLVGDPKQLDPIIKSQPLNSGFIKQLALPLFTRLMKMGHPSTLLVEQFRMLGLFSNLTSWTFYQGSLVNAPGTSQENRLMAQKLAEFNFNQYGLRSPGVIIDATSHAEKDPNFSTFNYITASITLDFLEKLVALDGVKAENIAILTRYTAQIRVSIPNPALLIEDVQINTIDSIQGGEADIPLLDLCVSNQIGFLKYLNRVNVATSRARDAIYIMIDIKGLYHGARSKDRK